MRNPPVRPFYWKHSHRLIPARYSESGTVLSEIAESARDLDDLILLDGATNDRVQSEERGGVGISTFELVYGIPNAHVVNAAFTHASESGARFSDHTRGAWYAADRQEAAIAEVAYHKSRRLSEIIVPGEPWQRPSREVSTFDDWLASFRAEFHTLVPPEKFAQFLKPEPVPRCYAASQVLARRLLEEGSNGLVYPCVRCQGAECVACFRPALVYDPHRLERLEIAFTANESGYDHDVHRIPALAQNP